MSKAKQILENFAKNPTSTSLETMETLVAYATGLELLVNKNAPTLRDQFAMATLQGLWGNPDMQGVLESYSKSEDISAQEKALEVLAVIAYRQADLMIKHRVI